MSDRICWECQHIYFSNGSPGYSHYTPGYDMELSCSKGHWEFDNHHDSLSDFRTFLTMAQNCPDFKPHKE